MNILNDDKVTRYCPSDRCDGWKNILRVFD